MLPIWKDMFTTFPTSYTPILLKHLEYRLDHCFEVSKYWKRDLQHLLITSINNMTKEELIDMLLKIFKHAQFTLLRYLLKTDDIPIEGGKLIFYTGSKFIIKRSKFTSFLTNDRFLYQVALHVETSEENYCFLFTFNFLDELFRIHNWHFMETTSSPTILYTHLYLHLEKDGYSHEFSYCVNDIIDLYDHYYSLGKYINKKFQFHRRKIVKMLPLENWKIDKDKLPFIRVPTRRPEGVYVWEAKSALTKKVGR